MGVDVGNGPGMAVRRIRSAHPQFIVVRKHFFQAVMNVEISAKGCKPVVCTVLDRQIEDGAEDKVGNAIGIEVADQALDLRRGGVVAIENEIDRTYHDVARQVAGHVIAEAGLARRQQGQKTGHGVVPRRIEKRRVAGASFECCVPVPLPGQGARDNEQQNHDPCQA